MSSQDVIPLSVPSIGDLEFDYVADAVRSGFVSSVGAYVSRSRVGTADFCGATVSIAGGASNRVVTIGLTDTNFKRIAVRVIPSSSKGAFSITKASSINGGSQYRFTLNAVKSNPKGARIILLFAAGSAA